MLFSDEAYHRIVFDGIVFRSPAADYHATSLIYTYGKTLLAPGQRIGFVALHPSFPDGGGGPRTHLRPAALRGCGFPNALLQHAIRELEAMSIDIGADPDASAIDSSRGFTGEVGYQVHVPPGHLLPVAPRA